jgi:hypothetical protein
VDLAAPALPTGPDVAAAKSTAKRTMTRKSDGKSDLTKEARLENAPIEASGFSRFLALSVQVLPCVRPVDAAVHTPLACMEIADRVQHD